MPRCDMSDDDEDESHTIEVVSNEVWFWGGVTDESMLELTTELRKLETSLLKKAADDPWGEQPGITLYIKTGGGDLYAGLSTMDFIWNLRVHVTTVVDGLCASAGTFLLLGGHTRLAKEYSFVLIHQIRTGFWGKYEDAKDEMKSNHSIMKRVSNLYKEFTTIPHKKLKSLMKRDIQLDSAKCLKYNIVEGIY